MMSMDRQIVKNQNLNLILENDLSEASFCIVLTQKVLIKYVTETGPCGRFL